MSTQPAGCLSDAVDAAAEALTAAYDVSCDIAETRRQVRRTYDTLLAGREREAARALALAIGAASRVVSASVDCAAMLRDAQTALIRAVTEPEDASAP